MTAQPEVVWVSKDGLFAYTEHEPRFDLPEYGWTPYVPQSERDAAREALREAVGMLLEAHTYNGTRDLEPECIICAFLTAQAAQGEPHDR